MKKVNSLIELKDENLKQNFLNKMSNDSFNSVVNSLKIDRNKLYKHTSGL